MDVFVGIYTQGDHFGNCKGRSRHLFLPSVSGRTSLCTHQSRGETDTTAMGLLPECTSFYEVTPISVRW
jgi:hypothetical protein